MKLTYQQAKEFNNLTILLLIKDISQRLGQAMFNALYQLHPDLADSVRGTKNDPFHNNGAIRLFLREILAPETIEQITDSNPLYPYLHESF